MLVYVYIMYYSLCIYNFKNTRKCLVSLITVVMEKYRFHLLVNY